MNDVFTPGFSYDDVLLIPKHSSVKSRDNVDLSVQLPKNIRLDIPIVSANMKSVTDIDLAICLSNMGGLPVLHRFDEYNVIIYNFIKVKQSSTGALAASVGVKEHDYLLTRDLYNSGCKIICVDVAHGDHDIVCDFVSKIKSSFQDIVIIAGNVATESGAQNLWAAGADIIKCGIGSGSTCSTRINTGNGYPQLSALYNICNGDYKSRDGQYPLFISDGGIRNGGDCTKSLVFSDLVMIGNLFAGTDEAPGEIIINNGQKYKKYQGSSTHKQKNIEGVVGLVPYRGSLAGVVNKLLEGIRSGCSYQGVSNLSSLKIDPEFVIISNSGLRESHPHDIIM